MSNLQKTCRHTLMNTCIPFSDSKILPLLFNLYVRVYIIFSKPFELVVDVMIALANASEYIF